MNLTIELSNRQKKAFLLHNHEVGISESEAHKFMEYKKIFIDFECLFDIDVAIAFELCFKYNKLNIFKWGNDNIPDVGYMRSILRNKGTNPIKCMVKNPEDPEIDELWADIKKDEDFYANVLKNATSYPTGLYRLFNKILEDTDAVVTIGFTFDNDKFNEIAKQSMSIKSEYSDRISTMNVPISDLAYSLTERKFSIWYLSDIAKLNKSLDKDFLDIDIYGVNVFVPQYPYNVITDDNGESFVKVDANSLALILSGGNGIGFYNPYAQDDFLSTSNPNSPIINS